MKEPQVIQATRPRDIPKAYRRYYSKLADHFFRHLGSRKVRLVLEAGCGRGQLTLPLLKKLPRVAKMLAVDSSKGPYEGWLSDMRSRLQRAKLASRVSIIEADAREMPDVRDNTVDFLVSNELLCDLTNEVDLRAALREFHRVLKPKGVMMHGEWSSHPPNGFPSFRVRHHPAWTPDQLHIMMREAGFESFLVSYFDSTVRFGYAAALEELRVWGASENFLKRNDRSLRRMGFQLPPEHVVRCVKPSTRTLGRVIASR